MKPETGTLRPEFRSLWDTDLGSRFEQSENPKLRFPVSSFRFPVSGF